MSIEQKHAVLFSILDWWINFAEEHGLMYYAYSGTLLGVIREKDIIPWDDDIDLVVEEATLDKLFKLDLPSHLIIKQGAKGACYKIGKAGISAYVDIFPTRSIGNRIEYAMEKARAMFPNDWASKDEIFPLSKGAFNRFILPIPNNPDACLTRMYGNWKVRKVFPPHDDE